VSIGPSPAIPKVPGLTAGLGYLSQASERPYNYMFEPPGGAPWCNCEYRLTPVWIADARARASPPTIDLDGFELCDAPTSMLDFRDVDALRTLYYPESAELAKYLTGAEQAFVFDHAVRRRTAGRPALHFGREGDGTHPTAVGRVHTDYSEDSGQKRLEIVVSDAKARSQVGRFAIVNIWRSIRGKVLDTPLGLCDARTISARDLVVSDLIYPHRTGEIYLVQHSSRHQWAYFSEMDKHEALVFKQYDSQVSGVARFTPHAAFDLPDIPRDAPYRESIEIRCLVTYG
jgi:hypothetical protein